MNERLLREWARYVLKEALGQFKGGYSSHEEARRKLKPHAQRILMPVTMGNITGNTKYTRIHTEEEVEDQLNKAKEIVAAFARVPLNQIAGVTSNNPDFSGTYQTHALTWPSADSLGPQNNMNIIFAGTQTRGQRSSEKTGYGYELQLVGGLGSFSYQNPDTKGVDVMVKYDPGCKKIAKIEAKSLGGAFGQPTFIYRFESPRGFEPSKGTRSEENAHLIAALMNSDSARRKLSPWMKTVREAWRTEMAKQSPTGKKPPMTVYGTQVKPDVYGRRKKEPIMDPRPGGPKHRWLKPTEGMISHPGFKQKMTVPADPEAIVQYYKNKGAEYIQLEGKGLYLFDLGGGTDPLGIGSLPMFADAIAGATATLDVEILTSGGNKALRATSRLDLSGVPKSKFDLDNDKDMQRLVGLIQKTGCDPSLQEEGTVAERTLRLLVRESLLTEELTKSDRKEIEKIARKQVQRDLIDKREIEKIARKEVETEIRKALGVSIIGKKGKINKFVEDEVTSRFKNANQDKDFDAAVIKVSRRVLKGLYDMHYKRSNLINNMPIPN